MISRALISRAILALEKAGCPVKAIRLEPNGSIVLLTDGLEVDASATSNDDWLSLAGEPQPDPWQFDPEAFEQARIRRGGRTRRKK
jgi:hypothetical protein